MIDRRILTHFDFLLVFLIIPIIILSFYLVNGFDTGKGVRELIYIGVGVVLFFIFFLIPFRKLSRSITIFYWIFIGMLLIIDFYGAVRLGAQRWIIIPGTGMSFQPSEPMKIALILMLANLICHNPPPRNGYHLKDLAIFSFYILLPVFLVAKQPDLGSAIVMFVMGYGILFIVGIQKRIIFWVLGLFIVSAPLLYSSNVLTRWEYQAKRVQDFISATPSHQVQQSLIAIGSAGWVGKSKEDITQTKFGFLPIPITDIIFSYYVERFGFLGAVALFAIYIILILHILSFCLLDRRDYFLQVVAGGVAILLFVYMSVNVAMTVNLAPIVGIPLPILSYGGSSFVTFMVLFGILENLLAFKFDFEYNSSPINKIRGKKGPLAQLVRALGS
ncbi:FtsW/RodA/SpoVE family cell cycle protein [Helicobacter sp. faydin-H20]|uniref:FtsW/RodA/SpoVE family cell cycle protein n=1 Tax=Helicobacter anatolicus TaxID=2905874 RepID=UPI001E372265|nr:FtsW/RodA/SpoVE family cell cycle protein [Helicobacter anatolicus]MCE3036561.1 FtsW/RodA/SpoVE family cell cycle protein [Helicobacter anatolicus]